MLNMLLNNTLLRMGLSRVVPAAVALILLLSAGCGLWHRVDRGLLDAIPNDEKLLLFDTENGVYIARDERETTARAKIDAERALLRARRYRNIIDERKGATAGVDSPETLSLLEEWNDARIELRDLEVDLASANIDVAQARLWTARAEYEEAKAKLVKDKDPEEGDSLDLESFADQLADRKEDEAELLEEVELIETEVLELRGAYQKLGARLQKSSRGAYGGPWADLVDG